MKSCPERAAALALLRKYNTEPFHLQHALTVAVSYTHLTLPTTDQV